jgi:adenylate cyclase
MAKDRLSGKFAVILHADIAGSTSLVQQDEQLAHERIQDAFRRFTETIQTYQGHILELRGDALLAEFERPSDAVAATLAFQTDHTYLISRLKDEIRPALRVGIAMGEVVIADNTVTGAGVVLAQRIEQLADPGGVCVTAALHEALPKRMPFDLENLGEQVLKGFDDPVRVYRVELSAGQSVPAPEQDNQRETSSKKSKLVVAIIVIVLVVIGGTYYWFKERVPREEPASTERMAFPLPDKPSIAVLPFTNMSGDPAQDYFADGITEDLTTDLSRISGLFVVARNSSFAYKGRSVDLRTVSQELGVRYVLEGSVRRVGDQIRINAQLVDGSSGGHLWAERFDGTMANVFALQDDVNRMIVAALEVSLTAADEKRLVQPETTNPEAYDLLLRGFEQLNRFSRDSIAEARDLFTQAATLDPNYARAYANIAQTYVVEVNRNWTQDRERSTRLGLEFSEKALALDDSIPQIYLTRSALYLSQRKHQAALEAAQRTIEMHPNYADGYASLAFIQSFSGQLEASLESLDRSRKINPLSTGIYLEIEGRVLFLLERYVDALSILEDAIQRNPAVDRIHLILAATYAELGRLDDASWSVEEALSINPDISLEKERRGANYMRASDLDHYIEALRKAGVPE